MGTLFRTMGISAGLALGLGLDAPPAQGDAAWQCRHIPALDAQTGAPVHGIEDIAVDEARGIAYLSSYNRRLGASGALYALPIAALGAPEVRLTPLAPQDGTVLRPHGLAFEAPDHLIVIDRVGSGDNYHPVLRHFALERDGLRLLDLIQSPDICHANDVLSLRDGSILLTNDHRSCSGPFEWAERILGLGAGQVWRLQAGRLSLFAQDIRFANGLALWRGEIIVSATRGDALLRYDLNGTYLGQFDLPGAPDNLGVGRDGGLYVTIFPSLIGYARFRSDKDAREAAPTRVLRFDPVDLNPVDLDLPSQDIPAGGTIAVPFGDWLLVGSAYDAGLGVCQRGPS